MTADAREFFWEQQGRFAAEDRRKAAERAAKCVKACDGVPEADLRDGAMFKAVTGERHLFEVLDKLLRATRQGTTLNTPERVWLDAQDAVKAYRKKHTGYKPASARR